ncbi:MAG: primosomal protein N' [Acidobacteria bacterium]|nr:MAG: primosomal protein N' [Acidobacteriota bacterium]
MLIGVAVPVPGLGLLTYSVPDEVAPPPKGARVSVPLGTRTVVGVVAVLDAAAPADATKLRPISSIIDATPFLPSTVVDVAMWTGDYYAAGPGEALTMTLPPAARRGESDAFRMITVASNVAASNVQRSEVRGAKQKAALEILRERGTLDLRTLDGLGISRATMQSLERAGLVRLTEEIAERDPFIGAAGEDRWAVGQAPELDRALTAEQTDAFAKLAAWSEERRFRGVLLQGVTGSGKTELYLQLARRVISHGRRVLMLVPEIALTPAVAGTFRARFGERVAIQHSGLASGERHDQWHRIRRGQIDIVVGTRSAVFAPLESVGLIVVDEEHDGSYKQDESPRYNGRDVAAVRAQKEGALIVFGTATPSMETAVNAETGRYEKLRLTRRIFDRPMAAVRVVDMRTEYAEFGADVILSRTLIEALTDRLAKKEQSVVLLNRRGFSTVVFCRQCGTSADCPHCSVTLTYHRASKRVRCHYCNYAASLPKVCAACGGEFIEQSGFGTEQLEHVLRERFPEARVARVDRDTIRKKGAIAAVLKDVSAGKIDILIGTQMIAKGHDFPEVTLVGVVSADVGLGLADFRASERTFQLLTQVVGRAGRGDKPGEALIQTIHPDHYSIRAAAGQDYDTFYKQEREFRERMLYPPMVAMISLVIKNRSADAAMRDGADLARRIRARLPDGKVLGPAPAPIAKIKDEHRVHLFLKGKHRTAMRMAVLAALADRPEIRRRVTVDVDPVNVL